MSETNKGGLHFGYVVAAGIFILMFPMGFILNAAGIFYTPVAEEFGISQTAFGIHIAITEATMALMLPTINKLFRKYDTRITITASGSASAEPPRGLRGQYSAPWERPSSQIMAGEPVIWSGPPSALSLASRFPCLWSAISRRIKGWFRNPSSPHYRSLGSGRGGRPIRQALSGFRKLPKAPARSIRSICSVVIPR